MARDQDAGGRITSLDGTQLACLGSIAEAIGIPVYVNDVAEYPEYGLTETGWYIFARVKPLATANNMRSFARINSGHTSMMGASHVSVAVDGAAGYIVGSGYVDLAVRFEVAAQSREVTIHWGPTEDKIIFRATDLAVRNLDYRTTFYIYDLAPYATWEYEPATDATFVEFKQYYVKDADGYELVVPTAGDTVPTAYYEQTVTYALTADETFASGKTYYTLVEGEYVAAEVTAGEAVAPETYYEQAVAYGITEDTKFADGKTYYTKSGTTYSAAEVTAGADVPTVYYVHSKVTFEGMVRNVTYALDTIIDCPSTFVLPEIEEDGHGAWFEMRFRHSGSYSSTLVPPSDDVRIATEHTQAETAGMNMVDLHYSNVGGAKVWRFMNTHSSFTAAVSPLASVAFRTPPATVEYEVGGTLDTTGAVVVATYEDGHTKIVTPTYSPANGSTLTAEDAELTATYTEGGVTQTASVALTVTAAQEPGQEGGE